MCQRESVCVRERDRSAVAMISSSSMLSTYQKQPRDQLAFRPNKNSNKTSSHFGIPTIAMRSAQRVVDLPAAATRSARRNSLSGASAIAVDYSDRVCCKVRAGFLVHTLPALLSYRSGNNERASAACCRPTKDSHEISSQQHPCL